MNETGRYLDRFAQVTSDVRVATIEAYNDDDDTYTIRYVDSGARDRAAKNNRADFFSLNERVTVQLPSASRTVIGSGPLIVSRAPRDQRGMSASTPNDERNAYTVATITEVDPDPLILDRGGAAKEHVIFGLGLDAAATYEASTGPDPIIVNDDPPIVTDTKVTMSIRADDASPLGLFDVVIGEARARDALRVIEPLAAPTDITLSNADVDENMPALTVVGTFATVDINAGETFTYAFVAGAGDADNGAFGIVGDQLVTAIAFDFEEQATRAIRVRSTDSTGLSVDKQFTITINDVSEIAAVHGHFVVGKGANATTLATIRDYDGTAVATESAGFGDTITRFVQVSNTKYLVFLAGGGAKTITINATTGAFAAPSALGTHPAPASRRQQFAFAGSFVYYGDSANRFVEVNVDTGAVARVLIAAESTPFYSSSYHSGEDAVYTGNADLFSGSYRLRRIELGGGGVTTVNLPAGGADAEWAAATATDSTDVYVWASSNGAASGNFEAKYAADDLAYVDDTDGGIHDSGTSAVLSGVMFVVGGSLFRTMLRTSPSARHRIWRGETSMSNVFSTTDIANTTHGMGAVLVLAADGTFGSDLVWYPHGITANPMRLTGHRITGSIAAAQTVIATAFTLESADYGLGWTVAP